MSGILEALDAMYEVKGEAEADEYTKRKYERLNSLTKQKGKNNKYIGGREPMKNRDDYFKRREQVDDYKKFGDNIEKRREFHRMVKSYNAKNECTETIDTLEGILL